METNHVWEGHYSSVLYDTDSVYCIQVVPLDIMSAEIQLLPLIQKIAALIISGVIILSDSKAQGRQGEPALQEMDVCYCLQNDSVFQSGPLVL